MLGYPRRFNYFYKIVYLITGLSLAIAYQGCSPMRALEGETAEQQVIRASLELDGANLYAVNCATCHGPIEFSPRRNRTFRQISAAINEVSEMNEIPSLVALTPPQVQAIANALSAEPEPDTIGDGVKPQVVFQQPLGNRLYMAAKMKSVFSQGDATTNQIIDSYTRDIGRVFGGPCTKTMPNCSGDEAQNIMSLGIPTGNVLRNGYRIKACEAVLERDSSVTTVLSQLNLNASSARSPANVGVVFNELTNVNMPETIYLDYQAMDATIGNSMSSWRMILLTICNSSLFENF